MGGSTKVPTPKRMDIGQAGSSYLNAEGPLIGQTAKLEAQYRPQFGQLNLADMGQYTTGLQDIQGKATQTAQGQLTSAKAGEIASMQGLSDSGRTFLQKLSPEMARLTEQSTAAANDAYGRAGTLSPEQMRLATQQADEAASGSGRIGGNADIASQILNREGALSARRAEAAQAGSQAYAMNQNMYQAPLMSMLGSPAQSYGAGQYYTNQGMSLLGKSTPQLINPDTGINIESAYQKNVLGAQSAQAQANASSNAGMFSAVGSLGGAGMMAGKLFLVCIPSGQEIDTPIGSVKIDDINPGDFVIGFDGNPIQVLQKHSYMENPLLERFVLIEFEDGSTVSLCDKHKINDIESASYSEGEIINGKKIKSISIFGGVTTSFDLLTSDKGYQISGVPVNSMIEELCAYAAQPKEQ